MKQAGRLSLALCALLSALPRAQTDIDQSSAMAVTNTMDAEVAVAHTQGDDVRPFKVNVSAEALNDLRRRLKVTRWADKEIVTDASQGVQLATLKELVRYWSTTYDWRKAEARLNALPQFVTTIDGLDIHFIHVKSKEKNALPIIITHGWPGSIIEQLKIIGLLSIRPPTAAVPRTRSTW